MATAERPLETDLANPETRPWFLWDEDLSVRELRAILADQAHPRWVEYWPRREATWEGRDADSACRGR